MKNKPLFVINIRKSIYNNFGLTFYQHLQRYYHLIPIINNLQNGIEDRAKLIKEQVQKKLDKLNISQVHMVGYSLSGIDLRYALTMLGLGQRCKSLTTIGSPHKGSIAASFYDRKIFKQITIEPITRIMGIGLKPFCQFVPRNMLDFNNLVTNLPHIKYFSIGGQTLPNQANPAFHQTGNYLRTKIQNNYVYQNDGIFGYNQIVWGQHLVNFQLDHLQLVGVTGKRSPDIHHLITNAQDHIKVQL